LLSREKVFERTPKFGIVGRTGSWRTSSYARIKDHYVMVDLAVAAYTLSTTIYLFYSGMYSFMLVSGLFTAAVLYNVFVSVTQGEGAVRNFYMGSKNVARGHSHVGCVHNISHLPVYHILFHS
jgi:hypothetical protein